VASYDAWVESARDCRSPVITISITISIPAWAKRMIGLKSVGELFILFPVLEDKLEEKWDWAQAIDR
jgi:hypothetical protein